MESKRANCAKMQPMVMRSPALQSQSQYYPVKWDRKVPKRVKMLCCVKSELPFPPFLVIRVGEEYPVWVNSHGAVSAILESGLLGLKPEEFEIIEWHQKKVNVAIKIDRPWEGA